MAVALLGQTGGLPSIAAGLGSVYVAQGVISAPSGIELVTANTTAANPPFAVAAGAVANCASGVVVTPAVAGGGVTLSAASSAAAEVLTIASKGVNGPALAGGTAAAGSPALSVLSVNNAVTGVSVSAGLAGAGCTLAATSTAVDETLVLASKGAATLKLQGASFSLVQSGTGRAGDLTANGVTGVTIACPTIQAESVVVLTPRTVPTGGIAVAGQYVLQINPATNFIFTSVAGNDAEYNWMVLDPT